MAVQQTIFFYCISRLPQSLAYIIFNTGPIWIYILSFFLYGQHIGIFELLAVFFTFVGVFMSTAPNYVYELILNKPYVSN
jgi:drug/metabolite transporter (DMT)-like permease